VYRRNYQVCRRAEGTDALPEIARRRQIHAPRPLGRGVQSRSHLPERTALAFGAHRDSDVRAVNGVMTGPEQIVDFRRRPQVFNGHAQPPPAARPWDPADFISGHREPPDVGGANDVPIAQLLSMHRAVVRGDLQALHSPAVWFAEHGSISSPVGDMDDPARSLKLAAGGAAAATDVSRAAAVVAEMIVACGHCHRQLGVSPSLPSIVPSHHTSIVGHMLRHEQAAEKCCMVW